MNVRRAWIAASLSALLVFGASGAVIAAYWPRHGWASAFAHAPAPMRAYLIYWLMLPANALLLLLACGAASVFWRGKATPSQERWAYGTVIVAALGNALFEAIRIGGLFVARAQRARFIAAGGDPHRFHFDTNFLIMRISAAIGALVVIWLANRTPKLMARVTVQPGNEDWARAAPRLGGWLMLVIGLAGLVCAFLQPFQWAMMLYAGIAVGGLVVWLCAAGIYRVVGPPKGTASRQ